MKEALIEQLKALLPPVSYDPNGSRNTAQLRAEAGALAQAIEKLAEVEAAIFPATSEGYIGDWERVYALVTESGATQAERVAAVEAAMADLGGQSIPYFISLARRLGVEATVDANRPALTQVAKVGDPAADGDALFDWRLNAPLSSFKKPALESLLSLRKPANTVVTVGYGKSVAEALAASADRAFSAAHYVTPEAING